MTTDLDEEALKKVLIKSIITDKYKEDRESRRNSLRLKLKAKKKEELNK